MKKRKQKDYTLLFHILIILLIAGIIYGLFIVFSRSGVNNIAENTGNFYKEKIEDTQKLAQETVQNIERHKEIKPFEKYKFKYIYTLNIDCNVKYLFFEVKIPSDEAEKQYISELNITPKPAKTFHDGTNNIAQFVFNDIKPQKLPITVEGVANIRTYDLYTAKIINKNSEKENNLSRYLAPEELIESDDKQIQNIAQNIEGNTKQEIIDNVYKYLQNNIKYTLIPKNLGAKETLRIKQGKCSEYSALMIALLRAKDIPSRMVCGNIARNEFSKHGWVEVYFDNYGWVAFDPTVKPLTVHYLQNGKVSEDKKEIFDSTKAQLSYIASGRNCFSTWDFKYLKLPSEQGNVRVSENIDIQKE